MKFTMPKETLSRTLQSVVSAVPPKSTLPILSNFLLEARDGKLMLTCTDLDVSVRTEAESKVADGGKVTVPAKRFAEIVRELPPDEIVVGADDLKVTLDCRIGQFTLMGMDAEEFPKLPDVEEGARLTLPAREFGRAIRSTAYAVSEDETRPVLNGVLVEIRDGAIRLVATDGHRLARFSMRDPSLRGAKKADAILPPKTLNLVERLSGEGESGVEMMLAKNYAIFTVGETTIYSRLLDGPFPAYEQVIPKDNPNRATLERGPFIASLRRISILADSVTHQVKLSLRSGKVELSAQTADVGEGTETLPGEYAGTDLDIGFNARYVSEALRSIEGEKVILALDKPTSAGVLTPAEADQDELLCLVMPLRLSE
jgi:DNA polymerase-3 subunit beta